MGTKNSDNVSSNQQTPMKSEANNNNNTSNLTSKMGSLSVNPTTNQSQAFFFFCEIAQNQTHTKTQNP